MWHSLNRGIGIEVLRELDEILAFLLTKSARSSIGVQTTWVLQKYIENPVCSRGLWLASAPAVCPLTTSAACHRPPHTSMLLSPQMLIHSRKFDIRIWVLLNDSGDVFLYLPGYIRTSSEAFSLDR